MADAIKVGDGVGAAPIQEELLARFWRSGREAWRSRRTLAAGLATFLITVTLLQLFLQVLLNAWNRNFFDALERKDGAALWEQARIFLPLAAGSIALAAASVWGRMTTQRGWREALSRHVIGKWLANGRFRGINPLVHGSENPEYRIAVDIRMSTDAPVDMALALLSSFLTAITFFGVLWSVGGSIEIVLFGHAVTIPGYLVLGVIAYSSIMSGLMLLMGRNLTNIIERTNQSEAEFRAAADAFGQMNGHDEGRTDNVEDKQRTLWLRLQAVLIWWREYCRQLVRTTLVSHGNFLLAPVVAWILCVPKYLSGVMSLGELTQAAAAFVTVQGAFNWLVDNYQRLADCRSAAYRVATLLVALDALEAQEAPTPLQESA